jgi:hypothetical protein
MFSPSGSGQPSAEVKAPGHKRNKPTTAQWAMAETEYDEVESERVVLQTPKLIERVRPYVEAEYAGDEDDPTTVDSDL